MAFLDKLVFLGSLTLEDRCGRARSQPRSLKRISLARCGCTATLFLRWCTPRCSAPLPRQRCLSPFSLSSLASALRRTPRKLSRSLVFLDSGRLHTRSGPGAGARARRSPGGCRGDMSMLVTRCPSLYTMPFTTPFRGALPSHDSVEAGAAAAAAEFLPAALRSCRTVPGSTTEP